MQPLKLIRQSLCPSGDRDESSSSSNGLSEMNEHPFELNECPSF